MLAVSGAVNTSQNGWVTGMRLAECAVYALGVLWLWRMTSREDSPFAGDCSPGTALAVFQITEAEVYNDKWPPPVAWNFSVDALE